MVGEFRHLITQNSGSKYLTVLDRNLAFVVTFHIEKQFPKNCSGILYARMCTHGQLVRDVSTGATDATAVAPKFSDTLTLFQPGGADSAHHCRGRS